MDTDWGYTTVVGAQLQQQPVWQRRLIQSPGGRLPAAAAASPSSSCWVLSSLQCYSNVWWRKHLQSEAGAGGRRSDSEQCSSWTHARLLHGHAHSRTHLFCSSFKTMSRTEMWTSYRPPPLQGDVLPQQEMELVQESHLASSFCSTVSWIHQESMTAVACDWNPITGGFLSPSPVRPRTSPGAEVCCPSHRINDTELVYTASDTVGVRSVILRVSVSCSVRAFGFLPKWCELEQDTSRIEADHSDEDNQHFRLCLSKQKPSQFSKLKESIT